jgi:sulfur carrier protein ThiS
MKRIPGILTFTCRRPSTFWSGLLVAFAWVSPAWSASSADQNRSTNEVPVLKSIFVYNDSKGKDPFFPNRPRPGSVVVQTNTVQVVGPNLSALQLLGITGPPDRRIALINNLTFVKGEEQEVRAGNGKVKIRVLEIREKSVVVTAEGQADPKELLLTERLLPVE